MSTWGWGGTVNPGLNESLAKSFRCECYQEIKTAKEERWGQGGSNWSKEEGLKKMKSGGLWINIEKVGITYLQSSS